MFCLVLNSCLFVLFCIEILFICYVLYWAPVYMLCLVLNSCLYVLFSSEIMPSIAIQEQPSQLKWDTKITRISALYSNSPLKYIRWNRIWLLKLDVKLTKKCFNEEHRTALAWYNVLCFWPQSVVIGCHYTVAKFNT